LTARPADEYWWRDSDFLLLDDLTSRIQRDGVSGAVDPLPSSYDSSKETEVQRNFDAD
jgi:hypothetical protein